MSNISEAYPFEEQLLDQGTGLLGLVQDRNRLLRSMYRQDLFQDFLLAEKLQSLDDAGGLDVQPISRKGFDLSPEINKITRLEIYQTALEFIRIKPFCGWGATRGFTAVR